MTLVLSLAEEADADRIADIHIAAFGSNLMLQAQFPTASVREKLKITLIEKVIDEIRDPKWAVLIARDEKEKEIVSFAKWRRPIAESERYVEGPWNWPDETRLDILEEWTRLVEDESESVLRGQPCYCLSFIDTDPRHERRGAASMLIQWGLDHSKHDNVPVALESTLNEWPLYEKLGFRAEEDISMVLEGLVDGGKPILYEEKSLISRPLQNSPRSSISRLVEITAWS